FDHPVVIRSRGFGYHTFVKPEHPGLVLDFRSSLTLVNGGVLSVADLHLGPQAALTVTNAGELDVSGTFTSEIPLTVTGNGVLRVASFSPTVSLTILKAELYVTGTLTLTQPLNFLGGEIHID